MDMGTRDCICGHWADECDQQGTESAIRSVKSHCILWSILVHRGDCHQHKHSK